MKNVTSSAPTQAEPFVPEELVEGTAMIRLLTSACPRATRLRPPAGGFGCALTIDVEEWYHTCQVPGYVRPESRPELPDELDRQLPELLGLLAQEGRSATFFVLGEVAERLPGRVREIAAAGHEVASHGYLHLRATDRSQRDFARDVTHAKALLEDLVGAPVRGYRAPEWSLRCLGNERLPLVAEAGYTYDSSLAPYPLAGRPTNPRYASRLAWKGGEELLEFPPLSMGGPLCLPAGSWTGRLAAPARVVRSALAHHRRGGLPVFVVHPWELTGIPTPGELPGLARFVHETGRMEYLPRFRELLAALPWTALRAAADLPALAGAAAEAVPLRAARSQLAV